jgi:SpoIIAA-like
MIEKIDAPDSILAFRATGKVEKADYESVLEPAVKAMIADRGEVRLVYVLGEEFSGYSIDAGWHDTKLGIADFSKWKRSAIVTNHEWIRHGVGMFRWIWPGEIKIFDLADINAAIEWAAA